MSIVFSLVAALLIGNFVSSLTERTGSGINTFPIDSNGSDFTVQTRQFRTSSTNALASSGNNLNAATSNVPSYLDVLKENFRAISPTHFISDTRDGNKMTDLDEGSKKSLTSMNGNRHLENKFNDEETLNIITPPSNFYWDNCIEKSYKYDDIITSRTYDNVKNAENLKIPYDSNNIPSVLSKRDSHNKNYSIINSWLDKYNQFMNPKRVDNDLITDKVLDSASPTDPAPTVKIIPITEIIFRKQEDASNQSFNNADVDNDIKDISENYFEASDQSKIKFSRLPQTQNYLIPKFKLDDGLHPFTFMSKFFSVIYPFEYPIEYIKSIVWGKYSFPYSFLQTIRLESSFLVFIITFGCFALIVPIYLLALCIMALITNSKCREETDSGALFLETDKPNCRYRLLVMFTFVIVLFCCCLVAIMVLCNEQSRMAVEDSYNVMSCACTDVATWLSTAAQELHNSLVPPVDVVHYAYKEDLRNIEQLLGEPIKQAIASESGIDLVLDSMADIITESEDLSTKVSSLRDVSIKAGLLSAAASERITDLAQQLDSLKGHCASKDAPLCDTLNTNSLQLMMKFDSILREEQLLELHMLGVHNLTQEILTTRKEFRTLPSAILLQTERVRGDILRDIELRRQIVHNSSRVLNDIVRHLAAGLRTFSRQMDNTLGRIQKYEFWRWTITLACTVAVGVVMVLIFFGMLCGCGNSKSCGAKILQVSVFWLCVASLLLWCAVAAVFLVAGHAEIFACGILWDSPKYRALSTILDKPSPLVLDDGGVFDVLFKGLHNVTINVPIRDVIRECGKNEPAYNVFQLEKILDVNKETSYFEWDDLQDDLKRLSSAIDVGFLTSISANFNKLLNRIHVVSDVNLTKYRMEYNGPVVGKDLPSFVDQLENVAVQVTDLTTAGRLESLATRTQRLHLSNIKPLEQLRTELVFKLTELELQLSPFRRKLNISLSHIHTAQFYIDNQGEVIAQKKVAMFVSRLISHAAGWRTHALTAAERHAGRCGPLFSVYAAIRSLLCTQYISPLHGWWFCGFLLGFVWCTFLTPLCVKLWRAYGKKPNDLEALTLANVGNKCYSEPGTPATATCDNNWNTPGPPPPPRNDSW